MTGGSRIVAIGAGAEQAAEPATETEELLLDTATEESVAAAWGDEADYAETEAPRRHWIVPALALSAIAGWSAFFVWANQWLLGGTTPQQAVSLITTWAAPTLLVVATWILSLRNSRHEAMRFGDTARMLSEESARLEQRLTIVNRELSLAREFLSSQSRDLDSLGRVATEKLSKHAEKLEKLIAGNGDRIEAISTVSSTALDNMERLRSQLPVIASSAKDAANNIASAGRTAQTQLGEMIDGFNRLNEFGQASERHVETLRTKIDSALAQFGTQIEGIKEAAEARFADLESRSTEFSEKLDLHEVDALAAIRTRSAALMEELQDIRATLDGHESESLASLRARIGALRDESATLFKSMRDGENQAIQAFAASRERLEASVREALERLDALDATANQSARERIAALAQEAETFDARIAERNRLFAEEAGQRSAEAAQRQEEEVTRIRRQLVEIDEAIAQRLEAQEARSRQMADLSESIVARIAEAGEQIEALAVRTGETETSLSGRVQMLIGHLSDSQESASAIDGAIGKLTDDSVRLLELLQASSRQSSEDLPQAIAGGVERLAEIEGRIRDLEEGVGRAASRAEEVAGKVSETRGSISQSLGEIGALQAGLEAGANRHGGALGELREALAALDGESRRIADYSRDEMSAALAKLTEATRDAALALEESGSRSVEKLAEHLASEGSRTLEEVLQKRSVEAIAELEAATARAAEASQVTARRLRDQLARISELTDNLERRVAQARERAEEQVDNDFSRRVALLTESLNSNAIDIAKAMSSDVTDTAWAAYLRGDRGVFTRRAVRLLDTSEARSVAQIYRNDDEFRQHVSRYIHDFEAMLRQLLSTRDGHALSVTLLSSDMGKLYVALAQAIERLRD
ncbi:ATPase [Novosphingobium sp. TH158]|uniref:ATPase n=1 Tax=Novosphingobium sp. TH158 TaxID=2067455 RepID=UPI000C7B8729|nr:ATPase [Novosphingobium sp. TH158]PLK25815.1 ATPase [Novosphingobium sp. TH158]